jgi:hypothetical protein
MIIGLAPGTLILGRGRWHLGRFEVEIKMPKMKYQIFKTSSYSIFTWWQKQRK